MCSPNPLKFLYMKLEWLKRSEAFWVSLGLLKISLKFNYELLNQCGFLPRVSSQELHTMKLERAFTQA